MRVHFQYECYRPCQAHDHAVKCLGMNSNETMFCTGSADGDIKVSRDWWRVPPDLRACLLLANDQGVGPQQPPYRPHLPGRARQARPVQEHKPGGCAGGFIVHR